VIQYYLGQLIPLQPVVIFLSSAFFTVQHYRKKIAIVQMIDILIFSILISILFHFTQNLYFTILVHIVRNLLIILQKYINFDKHA
jgi:membrane protease YdiL (CAAX protease family)